MPLYRGNSGGGLPPGQEPGKVLGTDDEGEPTWVEVGSQLFRGDWAADSIARQFDMTGAEVPPELVFSSSTATYAGTTGAVLPTTVAALAASGAPGPYASALNVRYNAIGTSIFAQVALDLSQLDIENITRVTAWFARTGSGNGVGWAVSQLKRNATVAASVGGGTKAWEKLSTTAVSSDVITFRSGNTYGAGPFGGETCNMGLTGIEIYATAQPYMRDEVVTHSGEMWKSLIDNNGDTPSAVALTWQRVLTLPPVKGTTAQRPSAVTAESGYQYYDTTLGQPIWSNGTAWTDATGTAL